MQQRGPAESILSAFLYAGCELLCAACDDKVAQIFYAAIPVLNTLFSGKGNVKVPTDGQDDYARATLR